MNQHPTTAKSIQSSTGALRFDVAAGLTAAAAVLSKAMVYAAVAGLPVAVGLLPPYYTDECSHPAWLFESAQSQHRFYPDRYATQSGGTG